MARPVKILVVCTANICRSPYAEHLIASSADHWGGVEVQVSSAGVNALVGSGPCPELWSAGSITPNDRHVARQVDGPLMESSDLVVAMAADHRASLVTLAPKLRSRVFTLVEAARLASLITAAGHALDVASGRSEMHDRLNPLFRVPPLPPGPADRIQWMLAEIDAWRGGAAGAPEADSIADPHMERRDIHPAVGQQIIAAVASFSRSVELVLAA